MVTKPSPPRLCPTSVGASRTMRCDSPPTFMISPASMKKGTTSSELSAPLITFCARICASNKVQVPHEGDAGHQQRVGNRHASMAASRRPGR